MFCRHGAVTTKNFCRHGAVTTKNFGRHGAVTTRTNVVVKAPLRQDKFLSSRRRDDKKQIVVTAPLRQGKNLSSRRRHDKKFVCCHGAVTTTNKFVVTAPLRQQIYISSRRRDEEGKEQGHRQTRTGLATSWHHFTWPPPQHATTQNPRASL